MAPEEQHDAWCWQYVTSTFYIYLIVLVEDEAVPEHHLVVLELPAAPVLHLEPLETGSTGPGLKKILF